MSERSTLRLLVVQVLVLSLLATLLGRLFYIQVGAAEHFQVASDAGRTRAVTTPAPRGQLLDAQGRPLARNVTRLAVSVDRMALPRDRAASEAVLRRVADALGRPYEEVWGRTRYCYEDGAPPELCWKGSPFEPIPVAEDSDAQTALLIAERQEDYPGVSAELQDVREYPLPEQALAPHLVGYLGPVSERDLAAQVEWPPGERTLEAGDLVGRAGLERQYDADLRGAPGVRTLAVDPANRVTGVESETEPTPGSHVVTHLDAGIQAVAERALTDAMARARTEGDPNKGGARYAADSGAIVVMDVRTGGVIAMASAPSYDPNVWVGGISDADYAAISGEEHNYPSQSRAYQGEYAPASTFKVVSLPAAVQDGASLRGRYDCTPDYRVGGRTFRNYESRGYGPITLKRAIEVSCDTVFYRFAYGMWLADGGTTPVADPKDPMVTMAKQFGLGEPTGLDLPGERAGLVADREHRRAHWEATREGSCRRAETGYPELEDADPERAAFLTQLARENCADGYAYRAGDAVNFSIGQGDTRVTPLQMARVYAAIANGGTLWEPHVAKAVVTPGGDVVRAIAPKATGTLPLEPEVLAYLQDALRSTTDVGSARGPFARAGFPLDRIPVASKTGTGEVYGKQTTSWFTSYAPADDPRYAIAMVVSQGGTGSGTSGPAVVEVYEALFGVTEDGAVDPARALLPGGAPPARLPDIAPDGTVAVPAGTTYGSAAVAGEP